MTNRADFIDALDDCISRLNAGETLESCLQHYPDLASQLRPLLLAGHRVKAGRADAATVSQARERVRARIASEARQPRRRAVYWPGLALAASLVLVFAVVLGGGFFVIRDQMLSGASPSPAAVVTLTPRPTDILPSATAIVTVTLPQTDTPTEIPSPTATATLMPTNTPTLTMTPGKTATRRPTVAPVLEVTTTCEPSQPDGWVRYAVRSGETLSGLASRTGTTLARLMEVNCIEDAGLIVIGQQLYLPRLPQPVSGGATAPPTRMDNSGSGSQNSGSGTEEPDDDHSEDDEPKEDNSGSGSGSDDEPDHD